MIFLNYDIFQATFQSIYSFNGTVEHFLHDNFIFHYDHHKLTLVDDSFKSIDEGSFISKQTLILLRLEEENLEIRDTFYEVTYYL